MHIREYLSQNKLLFDGSMGTYFAGRHRNYEFPCEIANIRNSDFIREIHAEYLKAGCNALKTNTFAANPVNYNYDDKMLQQVIGEGCKIALETAETAKKDEEYGKHDNIYVFADIGPVSGADEAATANAYRRVCDMFIAEGMTNFLFETQHNDAEVIEAAEYIRSKVKDAFVIASFAIQADGYTREGIYFADIVERVKKSSIDAVGMNCISSALHMRALLNKIPIEGIMVSIMPNAGYPRIVGERVFYDSDPHFFAEQMAEISAIGVSILGGCCGTDPRFIKSLKVILDKNINESGESVKKIQGIPQKNDLSGSSLQNVEKAGYEKKSLKGAGFEKEGKNRFWQKLDSGEKVIAVELDPPEHAQGSKFMSGAWLLKEAGADAITVADCPTARVRIDSSIMACKLRRELDMEIIPHMTCRDRNLNATKALLLGLSMEGVHNVLAVTGDPIPSSERDEVKSVYQFNSRMLSRFITSLNETELSEPFKVYGALNINARRFDIQLQLAKEKIANGIVCFFTQPVLTEEALENLKKAHDELDAKIMAGIMPVVSSRNARFMNSEISGITVDEKIIHLYENKSREECTNLAISVSLDIAGKAAPYADGYYLMTPFSRTDIISEIIKNLS